MKYFDKNGVEIKAGMSLLMGDGITELVYNTIDNNGNPDLGISANNKDYLRNHPDSCYEYYSLGSIDLHNVEVSNGGA